MSEASFHRSVIVARPVRAAPSPPLRRGYGLLIASGASLGLWGAIVATVARAFA